jgi:hypothetical protein
VWEEGRFQASEPMTDPDLEGLRLPARTKAHTPAHDWSHPAVRPLLDGPAATTPSAIRISARTSVPAIVIIWPVGSMPFAAVATPRRAASR